MRSHFLRALLLLSLLVVASALRAQVAWVEDWADQEDRMKRDGFAFQASYTGSFFSHLNGGLRDGTNYQGLLDVSVLMDLEHLLGWKDTSFHAEVLWLQGARASSIDYVGNLYEVSNIQGLDPTVRPFHVWLSRHLFDDKLTVTAGWMSLDTDFMVSESASLFINSGFGPVQTWNANFGAPVYPVSALGFLAQWQLSERQELQFGVYDGNAGGETANQHSANTRVASDDGAALLLEWTRNHTWFDQRGTFKLGAGWNTGVLTDYHTGQDVRGNGHVYMMLDQTLIPGPKSDSPDRLAVFTRMGHVLEASRSVVDYTIEGGVVGSGFRDGDRWGLVISHSHFGQDFVRSIRASGERSSSTESVIELTYQAALADWLTLQPSLQYIHHPQSGAPSAIVLGLVLAMSF